MGTGSTHGVRPDQLADLLAMGLGEEESETAASPVDLVAALNPDRLEPGSLLGDFKIIEKIGQGGMGVVYKARQQSLRRMVALKVLAPHIANDASAIKRFQREAILAGNLTHPHIVPIYELDDRRPPRYFTMEFIRGRSLRDKIQEEGFVRPDVAVRITLQICDALHAAHNKNVLHRDIKPSNILLENGLERVRVTDFGLAQDSTGTLADVTETEGVWGGTPPFMSPEQNLGEKLDVRTDIFSLGVTMYFMLTGKLPYRAKSRVELAVAFKEQRPKPPSLLNPDVTEELDHIALKMIAIDKGKRYLHCREISDCLEALAPNEIVASPQSRVIRSFFRMTKRIAVLACLALVVLLLGIAAVHTFRSVSGSGNTPGRTIKTASSFLPYSVMVNSPAVTVFDRDGRDSWSIRVNGKVIRAELAQLYSDRPEYLVVGVGGTGEDSGKVLVYDNAGELAWSRNMAENYPYTGSGVNRMVVKDLFIGDLWQDGQPHIVVIANDLEWYPSKVTILDQDGVTRRTYWHPGHLVAGMAFKPARGDRMRIVAWGCNNDMRSVRPGSVNRPYYYGVFCLDPETMSGEAPPRFGRHGEGTELWYGLLLPQGVEVKRALVRPPRPGAAQGSHAQSLEITTSGELFLYLTEDGDYLGRGLGDSADPNSDTRIELIK